MGLLRSHAGITGPDFDGGGDRCNAWPRSRDRPHRSPEFLTSACHESGLLGGTPGCPRSKATGFDAGPGPRPGRPRVGAVDDAEQRPERPPDADDEPGRQLLPAPGVHSMRLTGTTRRHLVRSARTHFQPAPPITFRPTWQTALTARCRAVPAQGLRALNPSPRPARPRGRRAAHPRGWTRSGPPSSSHSARGSNSLWATAGRQRNVAVNGVMGARWRTAIRAD
jgi:hypothetical protein